MQLEDNPKEGSLGPVVLVDNRKVAVHKLDVPDIQLMEELADQFVTFAETVELPLLVVVQTCHLACPSQSYAESAYMHKPCSKPYQPNRRVTEMPLKVHHSLQSLRL